MLGLIRIVLGQADGVIGDAAPGIADCEVTVKPKVGQISTVGVSTSESTPYSTAKTPSIPASISPLWRASSSSSSRSQRAETRLHSTNHSTVLGDRAHSQ
jgi:hypothetical protein